ncbi:hypothetical protein [Mucilaginibacter sp. dw_454]|uniref:hypothetical protein n=1 Tax=Mucilaginibacter sp. dw_454 TaxID=2720079 RepID=UPI001BD64E6D|nr:hypothetical protein [Mucilaginibacter sp. dw_454]
MDVNIYIALGAVVIVAIIVLNHQKQKNKMKTMLGEAGGTQLIFLTKAVEKKNKALADILYDGGIKPSAANTGTTHKDMLIKQLEKLEKEFAAKKISLRTYDEQLFDLLEKANKLVVVA